MVRNLMAVLAAAVMLASCGRQVTPDRTGANAGGLQPGQMQIKVTAQSNLDFVNNWYVLPFDLTCANGTPCTPYAVNGTQTNNWQNWDFEMVIGQPNGSSSVQAILYQFLNLTNSTTKYATQVQNFTPNIDLVVNPNCNGSNTQFCVTFFRRIFNGINPGPTPPPGGPGGTWYLNFLVASPQAGFNANNPVGQPIFAPGTGGLTDQTFQFPANPAGLDVSTNFDQTLNAQPSPPWMQASSGAAQLTFFEVRNNP